jgi:hypothetical protein
MILEPQVARSVAKIANGLVWGFVVGYRLSIPPFFVGGPTEAVYFGKALADGRTKLECEFVDGVLRFVGSLHLSESQTNQEFVLSSLRTAKFVEHKVRIRNADYVLPAGSEPIAREPEYYAIVGLR